MTATGLGAHPGRAVYQLGENQIVQTPYLTGALLEERMAALKDKLTATQYSRRLLPVEERPAGPGSKVALK